MLACLLGRDLAGTGKDERGLVERSLSSSREVRMPRSNKV